VDDAAWEALDPPQRRRRTLDAVKTLFLRESEAQPLVLMFEDLHWIDTETQAFLDSLVEGLPTARILLLVNYRPEYGHAWGSRTYYTQRRIDPLGPESASELLTALLGNDASVAQLAQTLIERTGGNPFFLEESVRTLVETGSIEGAPGAYRMTRDLDRVEVPATVQGILAARIDRLDVEDKRLLETASVIGKDVPFELLKAIADTDEDDLRRGLACLGAAEFLYEARLFPDLEYTFKHALTYEVAYGTLLQEHRRKLHRRIAEAIESLYGARLTEQFERLAHHYTEAGRAAQAIGYWQQAGQRAIERSANVEAIGLLERGLRLIETLPESPDSIRKEIAFRVALGVPLMTKEGVTSSRAEENYLRARVLCEEVGDNAQLFPVLWGLWMGLQTRSQLRSACEIADQLLTVSQTVDDSTLHLQAHHCQWTSRFLRGELPAALEHAEQGMALYRADEHHASTFTYGGHDPGACSHGVGAIVLWLLGHADRARAQRDVALALARKLGHPLTLFDTLTNDLIFSLLNRDGRAVRRQAEAILGFPAGAEELKFMRNTEIAKGARGWAFVDQGEVDAGLALMRKSVTPLLEYGVSWTGNFLSLMATALARHGDAQEGLELVTETLASARRDDIRWWEAELHRVKGEIWLARAPNSADEAEECFHQALDIARNQSAKMLELRAGTSLARLWLGQNRPGDARDLLAPIYGWFTEGFDTADIKDAKALLDELA
jgi:predicted ATPase